MKVITIIIGIYIVKSLSELLKKITVHQNSECNGSRWVGVENVLNRLSRHGQSANGVKSNIMEQKGLTGRENSDAR